MDWGIGVNDFDYLAPYCLPARKGLSTNSPSLGDPSSVSAQIWLTPLSKSQH
jgi:hypothetical protein